MIDQNKAEETQTAAQPPKHILTVLVDLSHENFAGRGLRARIALSEVLSGLARAALQGADATVVEDGQHKPVAVYMIAEDPTGEGKEAFQLAVQTIVGSMTQVSEERADFRVPVEG